MNEFRGETMSVIDKLLKIASENGNKLSIMDILNFDMEEEEFDSILLRLKELNIIVVDNTDYEEVYIRTKDQSLYNAYMHDVSKIPLLSAEEEKELAMKYKKGDKKLIINWLVQI